ncbi:hypothetical protein B0H17DRAFT_1207731 [Mycena rosella]|uniref:Uncharacterized protein n=1 Tax=Mycena rosella TaxID=1033263 RepID=A0AAD7GBI0_MYCRO|nr:hypothetical protein B0H17DRAFT_1207731 [Mycena rosella]
MGTVGSPAPPKNQTFSARRYNPFHAFTRRRIVWAVPILFTAFACLALVALWDSEHPGRTRWFGTGGSNQVQLAVDPLDPSKSVNGLPTRSFRDNLRPEVQYITSFGSGGWSNDVISIMNLIYLGLITERVPIIPVFLPSHTMLSTLNTEHTPLPFGDVFDLPHLRQAIGKPVLQWSDVKASNSTVLDDLGCWNVWESIQYYDKAPRGSFAPWKLKLDISYTKTPDWIKMIPNFEHDRYSSFWNLAKLAFPSTRSASLVPPLPSPKHNVSLPPDEHLLCYDFLYYVAAQQSEEIGLDYSRTVLPGDLSANTCDGPPEWNAWQRVHSADARREVDEPVPPFVSVHVRHNDFREWCEQGITADECFAPLPVIARRVKEVQDEIRERKGIDVTRVIVTSDEKNRTWWGDVEDLGWFAPDHSRTQELYEDWYTILIDAIIQSKGAGFVGTARSTVSVLSNKRVESWQDGSIRTVKWGEPGADDHP